MERDINQPALIINTNNRDINRNVQVINHYLSNSFRVQCLSIFRVADITSKIIDITPISLDITSTCIDSTSYSIDINYKNGQIVKMLSYNRQTSQGQTSTFCCCLGLCCLLVSGIITHALCGAKRSPGYGLVQRDFPGLVIYLGDFSEILEWLFPCFLSYRNGVDAET